MAATAASSISTPGAITLDLPGSSRWDTTTARRDFRANSSRGSRPYGAKATLHDRAQSARAGLAVDGLAGNGAQGRVRPPQDRGFRLLVTGNGIKLSMLPTVRHEDSATSTRKKNNPRKELETQVLFAEVVNFIQTRSRERLRSRRPRAPFRGAGLPSRPTSPASAGFFCGGGSPDFPLRAVPCFRVRMIRRWSILNRFYLQTGACST
jgi:hypothetical protein